MGNRGGLGPEYVAKSPPDGHTLLHYGNSVWVTPLIRSSRWDVLRDFTPVMLTTRAPNVLVVTLFAPTKTPAPVVNRINQEIARVLNTTESKERLFTSGLEGVASSPEEFASTLKTEITKWSKVIKATNIRDE